MTYPVSETFATSIPTGFFEIVGNNRVNGASIVPSYNAGQLAADIVFPVTFDNGAIITTADRSNDFWFEVDLELVADPSGNRYFGLWLQDATATSSWYAAGWVCMHTSSGGSGFQGWSCGNTATFEYYGAKTVSKAAVWNIGERKLLRIDWKYGEIIPGIISLDNAIVGYLFNPEVANANQAQPLRNNLRPGIYGNNCTLRVHSVAGGLGAVKLYSMLNHTEVLQSSYSSFLGTAPTSNVLTGTAFSSTIGEYNLNNHSQATQRIRGRVDIDGNPAKRQVRLFDKNTGVLIKTTWSTDKGLYEFNELLYGREYFVVTSDYAELYYPVVKDNILAGSQVVRLTSVLSNGGVSSFSVLRNLKPSSISNVSGNFSNTDLPSFNVMYWFDRLKSGSGVHWENIFPQTYSTISKTGTVATSLGVVGHFTGKWFYSLLLFGGGSGWIYGEDVYIGVAPSTVALDQIFCDNISNSGWGFRVYQPPVTDPVTEGVAYSWHQGASLGEIAGGFAGGASIVGMPYTVGVGYDADAQTLKYYINDVLKATITGVSGLLYPAVSIVNSPGGVQLYTTDQQVGAEATSLGYRAWSPTNIAVVTSSNATITEVGAYRYLSFLNNGTFNIVSGELARYSYLLVGGGGSAGMYLGVAGDGGTGGDVTDTSGGDGVVMPLGAYTVVVGAGGRQRLLSEGYGSGYNGELTSITGPSFYAGASGGMWGGVSGYDGFFGKGGDGGLNSRYGYRNYGTGPTSVKGGQGGAGIPSGISGYFTGFGGGGAGGSATSYSGSGGYALDGGGAGSFVGGGGGGYGVDGYGGGGGGSEPSTADAKYPGGKGGSGVVIIKYKFR